MSNLYPMCGAVHETPVPATVEVHHNGILFAHFCDSHLGAVFNNINCTFYAF